MYFPLARSASKLTRTFSSSPTLAGVPFGHPFVGQVTVGLLLALGPPANKNMTGVKSTKATNIVRQAASLIYRCLLTLLPLRTQQFDLSTFSGCVTLPQRPLSSYLAAARWLPWDRVRGPALNTTTVHLVSFAKKASALSRRMVGATVAASAVLGAELTVVDKNRR